MSTAWQAVESMVETSLQEVCKRELGRCDYIGHCAGELAYRETRAAEPISQEQVEARTERIKARISALCTGRLIDQGCWNSALCPASPEGESHARLRRIRT